MAVGAYGLAAGVFGVMFAMSGVMPGQLVLYGSIIGTALATIVAGLWLRDGRRRGAALAAVLDGVRVVLLVVAARDVTLEVVLAAVLWAGVIWLWPTLGATEVAATRS